MVYNEGKDRLLPFLKPKSEQKTCKANKAALYGTRRSKCHPPSVSPVYWDSDDSPESSPRGDKLDPCLPEVLGGHRAVFLKIKQAGPAPCHW